MISDLGFRILKLTTLSATVDFLMKI